MAQPLSRLLEAEPFSIAMAEKEGVMTRGLLELTGHHRDRCGPYARMLDAWRGPGAGWGSRDLGTTEAIADVPYLPADVFRTLELRSIAEDDVFKVMTSSGSTNRIPSTIYLDVETARLQARALSSIVAHFLGGARRPMLIIDHPDVLRDRRRFSARAAGILGMMTFGRDHEYALDEDMRVDRARVEAWIAANEGVDLLVFGFTFMVWQDFLLPLRDLGLDLSRATLVHSGGWKRLVDLAVSRGDFRLALEEAFGITDVHDFYGMVEQVGSIYMECEAGYFHAPNFADIIVRDEQTWTPMPTGESGVIEVVSLLPRSYPGHAILTQDRGRVLGVDDCPCGRLGRRFRTEGRVPRAEIRGCSDTQVRH